MKTLSSSAQTDFELVEAIKEGDKKAFEILYNKYFEALKFRFGGLMKDESIVEETINDAFVKLNSNIEKYNPAEGVFSTWLFTLTKNAFIDSSRRAKLDTVSITDLAPVSDSISFEERAIEYSFKDTGGTPETKILDKERAKKLNAVIDSLKPEVAEVVKMRYFFGMSYKEICENTGKCESAIKIMLFRAKENMKKELTAVGVVYFPCSKNHF